MPRALKNLDITLGLAVIPVQLFTATSSQGVAFHLLHAKSGSRIQMRLECPVHGIVPREETVRGYEISKDEYVRFEPEELKALMIARIGYLEGRRPPTGRRSAR
jgi:DNA end-binding protein Ku